MKMPTADYSVVTEGDDLYSHQCLACWEMDGGCECEQPKLQFSRYIDGNELIDKWVNEEGDLVQEDLLAFILGSERYESIKRRKEDELDVLMYEDSDFESLREFLEHKRNIEYHAWNENHPPRRYSGVEGMRRYN